MLRGGFPGLHLSPPVVGQGESKPGPGNRGALRILVTGAGGMLGREVCRQAPDAVGLTHAQLDVGDRWDIDAAIGRERPDVVINCAGVVRGRDQATSEYARVNAVGPHDLAEACECYGARLIHVSTDCVFDGLAARWYDEDDQPTPTDIYSRSKLLGEVTQPPHLTVRTSFVGFGPYGLLSWLMRQQGDVPGYAAVRWNGLTAPIAARCLLRLAEMPDVTGLLHVYGEQTTKALLLRKLASALALPVRIVDQMTPVRDFRLCTTRPDVLARLAIPPLDVQIAELARTAPAGLAS